MGDTFYFYTEQMRVGYNGTALIENIRMEVNRGEILTLIGPNGAGKSTILKSITRQLKLIGGTVYIDSRDMHEMSGNEIARKQAVVLTARINPEMMTCADVVSTGRYPYTGTLGLLGEDDWKKVDECLKLVHAYELRDRDFTATSDGQKQRVLLARAICQEPELIILDEPTSFLDIRHKLAFLEILRKMVKEQNVAVIMSLHELDLAQKISDRVMCVAGDHIDRCGTPEEIFESEYIRKLYNMETGSYDSLFGCMELPPTPGESRVFVIAGGGSGIRVYRSLQRRQIPFITGILQENDIDYEAARHLATQVLSVNAFSSVTDEDVAKAKKTIDKCSEVIVTVEQFGESNQAVKELISYAQTQGKVKNGA